MEWAERFLPWRLDRLSDYDYTALMDEVTALDLTDDENLRRSVIARYFLHIAVLSRDDSHPDCMMSAYEGIKNVHKNVPWCTHRMSRDELLDADRALGEIYC